jgi:MoCo/4Fe-4S cofactor protein with predicted Tat translocation signal
LLDVSPLTDDMSDQANHKEFRIVPPAQSHQAQRGHEHDDADEPEDLTVRESKLDLAMVREKLREKSGKQYWRTLEELADDPHFTDLVHREFPRHASEWDDAVDRRDFLKLMGASLALAAVCRIRRISCRT